MSGPVSTRMRNHLWMDKTSQYVSRYPGQLGLAIPPRLGTVTEKVGK